MASAHRRLGTALRALRPHACGGSALDARSADFNSGASILQPPDHPMHGAAPDYWKDADLESAARFTPSGVLTASEQTRLQYETRYFRDHGCIMIRDGKEISSIHPR